MRNFYLVAALIGIVATLACSKVEDSNNGIVAPTTEYAIGLPAQLSRTAIDDEGRASWITGDTFTLWAENTYGQKSIKAAEFTMMYYWHDYASAVFTSMQGAIAEGDYTYYAVSPKPLSVDNNQCTATYSIPTTQQGGKFNEAYDIMVATPLHAKAIEAEKVNNLALEFNHKMHILNILIAKNTFGLDISRLVLTFPTEVVGTITVDAINATNAPVITNGSNSLTLDFATPINEGDTAWGIIYPANITGDIQIIAYATDGTESVGKSISLNKELKEGHITPLHFTTAQINPPTLRFSIGANNLGEAIQKWSILDNSGNTLLQWNVNSKNEYTYSFNGSYTDSGLAQYAGATLVAQFESANAIVQRPFTMPSTISPRLTVVPAIDVPYLFYDDFSGVGDFAKDDYDSGDLRSADGMLFSTSVSGWNGAHIKAVAGKCVRVNVRQESTGGATRSNGRLDTPAMKSLKSGASVKLKVEFDMGTYIRSGYSNNVVYCMAGTHTQPESNTLNGKVTTTAFDAPDNDTSRIPSMFENHCFTTDHIAPQYGDNSFDSTFPTYSFTATNCNSATRLLWVPCTNQSTWVSITNGHYYLYIDNIRVSIAQ